MNGVNIPFDFLGFIQPFLPLILTAFVVALLVQIINAFTKDRVIKLFDSNWVVLLFSSSEGQEETFFGRLRTPARGKGFEIFFPPEGIRNPERLISFLVNMHKETGDIKYRESAEKIFNNLKEKGKFENYRNVDEVKENPFLNPSQASRKIWENELKNVYSLIRFKDSLDEKEILERKEELNRIYHPSWLRKTKRKIYNALSFVKNKFSQALSSALTPLSPYLPTDLKKTIEKYEKEAVSKIGSDYEPLLENSIGNLVIVSVKNPKGGTELYQGILREYSKDYLAIYDIYYKVSGGTSLLIEKQEEIIHQSKTQFLNTKLRRNRNNIILEVRKDGLNLKIKNVSNEAIRLNKVEIEGTKEVPLQEKVLQPGEEIQVSFDSPMENKKFSISYEMVKKADVIWPRDKATVIGLGEPVANLIDKLLLFRNLKNLGNRKEKI